MTNELNEVLGRITEDPFAAILETGYMQFESPYGINGLSKHTVDRLDILAVLAIRPGHGDFRRFISVAKSLWKTICVWEDFNPIVGEALSRYGFSKTTETEFGDTIRGWRWDAPSTENLQDMRATHEQ